MPESLNGLIPAEIDANLAALAQHPEAAHAPKHARVRWMNGLKAKVFVQNQTFIVDEAPSPDEEPEAPNAMEYVLGAFGGCLVTGFVFNATRQGLRVRNLEVTLESNQDNILTFLGLSSDGHPGFCDIRAKLYVQADASEDDLRQVWEHTVHTSPVFNSLTRPVNVTTEIAIL
ncbi:MAG: OsmC family protein [Candidatus Latescibacteria bacterium]|nr:OsmC family protein [Candidatus Latescibacterota bacterium]